MTRIPRWRNARGLSRSASARMFGTAFQCHRRKSRAGATAVESRLQARPKMTLRPRSTVVRRQGPAELGGARLACGLGALGGLPLGLGSDSDFADELRGLSHGQRLDLREVVPGCGSRTGADMGSIESYETTKGRHYRALYRRPDKKQTQKRGFTAKKAAELFLTTTEVDIAQGRYLDPSRTKMTVAEWLQNWLAARGDLRAMTRSRVENIIEKHIVPELGNVPIGNLAPLRVQEWAATA